MPKLMRQTNSAEQPIRCGTFGEKAVRPQKVQFEQAERYRDIANRLMEHYVGLFPDCAWVDEESAIARMALDITRLRRREIRHLQAILRMHEALKAVVGMRKPHPKVRDAHAMANLADQALDTELHMGDAGYFEIPTPQPLSKVASERRAIRAKIIYGGNVKRGKFCESPVDEKIFAEMTRPVVETPQADAEKEAEGGQ